MNRCVQCGAITQSGERYCTTCSKNVESSQKPPDESFTFPLRQVVIVLLVVVAAGLVLWFIAASCASGLSD